MKNAAILLALLAVWTSACGTATPQPTPTQAPTQTFPATITPSEVLPSASPTATPLPVQGTTRTQINVRGGPGSNFPSLGLLATGQEVHIVLKDPGGGWYEILYPGGPTGTGWISADYVQVDHPEAIPTPPQSTTTATPNGVAGLVTQKLNVRSGPAASYEMLGTLSPQTSILLTGKNEAATWLQIVYPAAQGGHAWVSAAYVQVQDITALPVLDAYGKPVSPVGQSGTPGQEASPTPTVGPAPQDGDSAAAPGIRVSFSPSGARRFTTLGQVSAPEGDMQDWVEFTPYAAGGSSAHLVVSLTCTGNGTLAVDLLQSGLPVSNWGGLQCGQVDQSILLNAGTTYQFRLTAVTESSPSLVTYTLTVLDEP